MTHGGLLAAALLVVAVTGLGGCTRQASQPTDEYANALQADISTDAVLTHLRKLQDIADQHGGTRQTGTPGYTASVDYVVKTLKDRGFDVQTPEFELGIFQV